MSGLITPVRTADMPNEWYRHFIEILNRTGLSGERYTLWSHTSVTSGSVVYDGTNPPTTAVMQSPIVAPQFSASATNTVHGQIMLPSKFLKGSKVIPFVRWTPSSTNTGDCYWRLQYSFTEDGTAFPSATTDNIQPAAGGTALAPQSSSFTTITSPHSGAGNFKAGNIFAFTLSRIGGDAADTFTGTAYLNSFGLYHRIGEPGAKGTAAL